MNGVRIAFRFSIVIAMAGLLFLFLQFPQYVDQLRTNKTINVLAWPNVIDSEYLEEFERKTGITVNLSYFENYEELVVKMRSGASDYDLVMASDYSLQLLIDEQVVKPIDHSRLQFLKDINPLLLDLPHDPRNKYSIPFSWEIFGIGIDTNAYKDGMPQASWKLLFDENVSPARVGMLDDAREIVSIAALYLFGKKKEQLSNDDLQKIQELLIQQKPRVAMYTDLRTDYLLVSQSAPVVLGLSSDLFHAMRKYDNIQFLIPQEGSFVLLDTFMLPASTQKEDLVYALLNYLYQPHIVKAYADRYNFFPALQGVTSQADRYQMTPTKSLFNRLRFFSYDIPEQALRDLWIALKS